MGYSFSQTAWKRRETVVYRLSSNHRHILMRLFIILLIFFVFTASSVGSTGPILPLDGDRCPGGLPVENSSYEWGYPDFIDTDVDAYNNPPSTSNITHLWFFSNKTDKNLYLALARAGGDSTGGRSDYAFFFDTDCNNNTGDTSPTSKGADYAISFTFQSGEIKDLVLKRWQGTGYVDVLGTNLQGLAGSYVCTGNDAKFAEFRIGIQYLFNPCSGSGCGEIELISAESYAGNFKSTLKDVLAAAAPIYINKPPTAVAGPNQTVCLGYPAYFDGSNSLGGDELQGYNDIVLYEWDFYYDGSFYTNATGVTSNHTYPAPGTYRVALRVTDAWGCNDTDTDGLYVTVIEQYPEITINKTADKLGPVDPGEMINYIITLNNTGDANFTDVEVTDLKLDSLLLINDANSSDNALNVSEIWSYVGTYNVTQEDACIGWVNNTASANATTLCETGAFYSNKFSILVEYTSSINITKTGNTSGPVAVGDQIQYDIQVCNTGDVDVNNIQVYDDFLPGGPFPIPGTLAPGQCANVTPSPIYTVTQSDVCRGWLNNSVSAEGIDICEIPVNTSANGTWNISIDYSADISVIKTNDIEGECVTIGAVIDYTYNVSNTGDVDLGEVNVMDDRISIVTYASGDDGDGLLNPMEIWTFKGNYTVKKEDICEDIVNNVTVSAYDPCGKEVNDTDYNIVCTVCAYCISGHKYWDKDGDGIKDPEDAPVKNWTILVRNESGSFIETKTNETGYWEICDLVPGIYNVSEEVKDGWRPTDPPSGYYDSIEVESFNVTGIDFLNTGTFCVSGHKYWDKDGNGVKDPMDEPLANWTIFIHEYGDEIADPRKPVTTTTGGDGSWKICNLPPGSYTVCEEPKAGWTQTYPEGSGCYSVEIIDESVSGLDFFNSKPSFKGLNLDEIAIGDQNALGFWGGDAINALTIEKDQQAGMVYQKIIPAEDCGCLGPNRLYWNTTVLNIERIDAGNQSASAGGDATGTNRIKVGSSQRTAEGCDC